MTRWKIYLKGTLILDWSPPSRSSASTSAKISKGFSRQQPAGSVSRVRRAQSKGLGTERLFRRPPTVCVRRKFSRLDVPPERPQGGKMQKQTVVYAWNASVQLLTATWFRCSSRTRRPKRSSSKAAFLVMIRRQQNQGRYLIKTRQSVTGPRGSWKKVKNPGRNVPLSSWQGKQVPYGPELVAANAPNTLIYP